MSEKRQNKRNCSTFFSLFYFEASLNMRVDVCDEPEATETKTTCVNVIQEARQPPLLLSNPREKFHQRLIAETCVGGAVISSAAISLLL